MIPIFIRQTDSCSFEDFFTGYQEAKTMLPNEAEATLTQLIRTRLKGDALRSIREVSYDKIEDSLKTYNTEKRSSKTAGNEAIEIENMLHNRDIKYSSLIPHSCHFCNKFGHTIETCTLLSNIKTNTEITCQLCKKTKHIAKDCREHYCQICNNPGHTATACKEINKEIHCQLYKRNGHTAKDCHFTPIYLTKQSTVCQNCQKIGHTADK